MILSLSCFRGMAHSEMVPYQESGGCRMVFLPIVRSWCVIVSSSYSQTVFVDLATTKCTTPRSPDLTPLDFYLWGYLKMKVFQTPPANLQDLRNRIVGEVQALRMTRQVRAAFQDMTERARRCVVLGGAQVEGRVVL